ncbi:MAG: nitroreductase family protein [Nostocaceae cyanobacterium]|nr:nitroreductase family protein [Nostocaceae cyanobacterium]
MSPIVIEKEKCKHCGICVEICPERLLFQSEKGTVPQVLDSGCISCGHCVAICPTEAITHTDFPPGSIHPIHPELLPSAEQVLELIRDRRSVREFRNKPVEKEVIEQIIEAARFAPSSDNIQSTEFVVIQDKAILAEIVRLSIDFYRRMVLFIKPMTYPLIRNLLNAIGVKKVEAAIEMLNSFMNIIKAYDDGNDLILYNAPVLILFHADRQVGFAGVNANLALQNSALMCEALKLGCFYTGFVVAACWENRIANLLRLPKDHKIYGGIALGYPKFKYRNWIERKPARIQWK